MLKIIISHIANRQLESQLTTEVFIFDKLFHHSNIYSNKRMGLSFQYAIKRARSQGSSGSNSPNSKNLHPKSLGFACRCGLVGFKMFVSFLVILHFVNLVADP